MSFAPRHLAALALAALSLMSPDLRAELQRWTFRDAVFRDSPNTKTGEAMSGGTLSGYFVLDTDTRVIVAWDITTSAGWASCEDPVAGNVCRVEGARWTRGDSKAFPYGTFFQLLRSEDHPFPLISLSVRPNAQSQTAEVSLVNSIEIPGEKPSTYRQFISGTAVLAGRR